MEEDLSITYCLEIAFSVTSPDIGDNNSNLLGVAQAESSKGSDHAHVSRTCWIIMMCLTRYLPPVVSILAQAFLVSSVFYQKLWTFSSFGFSAAIISVRSTFPTVWKNSLVNTKGPMRHCSSPHKMALEDLEFGKRALSVEHLQRKTVGSCLTICILYWRRGSKLPIP